MNPCLSSSLATTITDGMPCCHKAQGACKSYEVHTEMQILTRELDLTLCYSNKCLEI